MSNTRHHLKQHWWFPYNWLRNIALVFVQHLPQGEIYHLSFLNESSQFFQNEAVNITSSLLDLLQLLVTFWRPAAGESNLSNAALSIALQEVCSVEKRGPETNAELSHSESSQHGCDTGPQLFQKNKENFVELKHCYFNVYFDGAVVFPKSGWKFQAYTQGRLEEGPHNLLLFF